MKTTKVFYYGKYVVFGIIGLIAFTYLVMLLWNWLVPELFNGPVVNYWQTLGLLVLSKILFAGFSGGHGKHHDHPSNHWKKKYHRKMNGRYQEEEEDIKSKPENEETGT